MANILLVDDDPDLLKLLSMRLSAAGHRVYSVESAEAALTQLAVARPQLVVSDVRLPGRDGLTLFDEIRARHPSLPVILLTAHGTIPDAVDAMARGVFSYLTKPFDGKALLDKVNEALALPAPAAAATDGDDDWRAAIVSRSNVMADLLAEAKMVAASDASVLITGETAAARNCWPTRSTSPRARQQAFHCRQLQRNAGTLLESELFGHVRALHRAPRRPPGLFEAANGGTLFLDEIGDMPLALQVKLLRVLQERSPPGRRQPPVPVDVRILSATHRDLEAAMAQGQFREDLYYRLNVVSLRLPTLGERREDIPLLASHFLARLNAKYGKRLKGFAPDALTALCTASWPGNVRQLHNVVEQVCALTATPVIALSLVQRALRVPSVEVLSYAHARERFEREYLVGLLKLTDGNAADAARLAERNRTEFYRLLQKHGLTPGQFRAESSPAVATPPSPRSVAPE